MCLKKRPTLTCYNLYIHGSIATIFGKNDAEKVGNQNILYFPTSANASALPGETENPEIVSFHLMHAFLPKKTKHSQKYHLVKAEPPFTVKTIGWVHHTGLGKE